MTTAAERGGATRLQGLLGRCLRFLIEAATVLFIATVGTISVIGGTWWILLAGVAGTLGALVALAQPILGVLGLLLVGPELTPYSRVSLPAGIPDLTLPRLAVGLVSASVAVSFHLRLRTLRPIIDVEKAMLGFSAVIVVDLVARGANPGSEALVLFDEFLAPFLLFFVARNLFRGPTALRQFCYAMVFSGLVLSAHGTYQYARHDGGGPADLESGAMGHVESGRAVGPFDNSVEYGGFLSCGFFWAAFLAFHGSRGPERVALTLAVGFIGLGAVLSLTRAIWLGLGLALLMVAWLERPWRRRIMALLVVAVAGVTVVTLVTSPGSNRLEERTASKEPIYMRVVGYRAVLEMCLNRPLFGYGRGDGESSFVRSRQDYLKPVFGIPAYWGNMLGPPHNTFLSTLLAWGVVGLVFFVAIFFLLRHAWSLTKALPETSRRRRLSVIFLATSVVFLTQSMFADSGALLFLSMVYFAGAGVAFAELRAPEGYPSEVASVG